MLEISQYIRDFKFFKLTCLIHFLFFQATELCSYFKALGASNVDDDQNSDLSNIVAVADLCFKVSDK
jgi:hypothetical protein